MLLLLLLVLPVVTGSSTRAIVSLCSVAIDFLNHPLWQLKFSMLSPCTTPSVHLFLAGCSVGEHNCCRQNKPSNEVKEASLISS